jgi:riboflavin kinase / FMN adenylyltransferase
MKVHYNIDDLPVFNKAVITIGTFDGVHLGHRLIIENLKQEAIKINGETVIITFHPHPRKIVSSQILGVRLITTMTERIELLEQMGIDHLVIVPFTDLFAEQDAEDYIKNFLIAKFHPHTIIIGYDHRFGKERKGDYLLLEQKAGEFNYTLKEISKHILHEISISSSKIREAILHNEIEMANKLLGYNFFFEGEVVHGNKLGRQLGYPTANLKLNDPEKITPGNGIYAVYVQLVNSELSIVNTASSHTSVSPLTIHHSLLKGMMSIGFRPTVDGKERVIEVNIFDFAKEIYSQTIRVIVKKYLRPEVKFNSLEELVKQIDNDKVESLKVL